MNRKQQSVLLAGLLALVLAGCSSTRGSSDEMGGATGSGMGASGSMGSGAERAGSMAAPGGPGSSMMPAGAPNSVVMTIEVMPKPGAAAAGAAGAAVGGSGTAGATGSSTGDEKMYRITLRMDDGSTRVVTQDKAPAFRSGDRVNMTDGMITQ